MGNTVSLWPGGYRAMTLSGSTQNVGIGTDPDASARLSVDTGSGSAIIGTSSVGTGVYGTSSVSNSLTHAGVWGVGTADGSIGVHGQTGMATANSVGVFGESASSLGFGVYARNGSGGRALYVDGPASQGLPYGGLVKAMLQVDYAGTIIRCFNGTYGGTDVPCGFSVGHPSEGDYFVNFGFQVDNRFPIVQPLPGDPNVNAYVAPFSPNAVYIVTTFFTTLFNGYSYQPADNGFVLVIF